MYTLGENLHFLQARTVTAAFGRAGPHTDTAARVDVNFGRGVSLWLYFIHSAGLNFYLAGIFAPYKS